MQFMGPSVGLATVAMRQDLTSEVIQAHPDVFVIG